MSYVESNLMPNEHVVFKANIHWFIFVPGILVFILGCFVITEISKDISLFLFIFLGAMPIFCSFYLILNAIITKLSTELAVTNKRVIAKVGLIRRETIELN